jgi:hypothetical protein
MSPKGLAPPKEKLNLFSNSPRSELFDRLIRDFALEIFPYFELNASTRDLFKELLFAIYEKISTGHQRFFVISDNPVFVWLCLAELREFTLAFDRFLHDVFPEDCGKPLLKEVPEWIASYMAESALGIHTLVTKISPAESGRSKTRASEVTPGEHTRDIPKILGFTRTSVNNLQKAREDLMEMTIVLAAHQVGLSQKKTAQFLYTLRRPEQKVVGKKSKTERNTGFTSEDIRAVKRQKKMQNIAR